MPYMAVYLMKSMQKIPYTVETRDQCNCSKNTCNETPMRAIQGAHNLIIYPNADYAKAFGPLSCMYMLWTHVCARTCACVRMCVCKRCVCACAYVCACVVYTRVCTVVYVRALCTYVRVYTVVYVRLCVLCICACVCAYVCVHTHVKGLKTPFLLVSFLLKRETASQAVCPRGGP
jgi:hypothetical protein